MDEEIYRHDLRTHFMGQVKNSKLQVLTEWGKLQNWERILADIHSTNELFRMHSEYVYRLFSEILQQRPGGEQCQPESEGAGTAGPTEDR